MQSSVSFLQWIHLPYLCGMSRGLIIRNIGILFKNLLRQCDVMLCVYKKPKFKSFTTTLLLSTLGAALDQQVVLLANGTRGGILLVWRSLVCQAITHRVDEFSVSILF